MKYDDASWHYGGDYPKGLPPENGATHIGMFLAWIIERGLVGEMQLEESAKELARVKARRMTGAEFLLDVCDEKLTDEDLSSEGNRFAKHYFTRKYFEDYERLFGKEVESTYEIEDSWKNYDRLKPIIDRRYQEFLKTGGAKKTTAKKQTAKKKTAKKKTAKKKAPAIGRK